MSEAIRTNIFILIIGYLFLLSCQKEISCEDCTGNNKPPIADAGHDLIIALPKDSVILDGSKSKDPDGTITRYNWINISGPSSFVIITPSSEKTKVKNLLPGIYSFELAVTDNKGLSSKDTVRVTVEVVPVNHPPVANAGNDTTLVLPVNSIILNGSDSWDVDNNIIGYAWSKLSGPSTLSMSDPVSIQVQAGDLVQGIYLFVLTVTDAGGLSDKDTVQIIVNISPNQSPIADAGGDVALAYNLQACEMEPSVITLDGRASSDPDGTILVYQWSLIFAENYAIVITNPLASVTTVTNLTPGTYKFRLQVTDNDGASDFDTMVVTMAITNRPIISAQLIPIGILSRTRKVSAVATAGNKLFFAGGNTPPVSPGPHQSSRVDIYDINTGTWSTAELSQARSGLTAVASGNKVYFAGGTGSQSGQTSRVDIYDIITGNWSIMEMPRPGWYTSLPFGNNLFFAGGTAIDIYNIPTNVWTSKTFSQPRYQITNTNMQGKLFFAGGSSATSGGIPSSRIDMYDPVLNAWSESELSKPKYGMAGLGMRGKNVWAGGITNNGMTNEVEISDQSGTRFSCLFQSNSFSQYSVGKTGNNVVFFVWDGTAKNKFDIYDALNDTWTIGMLDQAITPSLVISVNDIIYVVGGWGNSNGFYDQVWKLQF